LDEEEVRARSEFVRIKQHQFSQRRLDLGDRTTALDKAEKHEDSDWNERKGGDSGNPNAQ